MKEGRDVWWHASCEYVDAECPAERARQRASAFHPLHERLDGKTQGHPAHDGRLSGRRHATRTKYVFDLREDDVYWCTADIGWVTGHSYVVYGPLANGATTLMYEGRAELAARPDRFWQIIERVRASRIFYTAPTAIRAFIRWGDEWPKKHDLSSLRLLGTVGEPINPEAWMWYHEAIGGGRCPIVDTWWQTETGAIMITPLPGATPTKPGSATLPVLRRRSPVVDAQGRQVAAKRRRQAGRQEAVARHAAHDLRRPRARTQAILERVPGYYFTGDGARRDEDGYFWIMGRVDDVLNVAGHRLGTMEVESALVSHPGVAEAAAVGRPDELKGQGVVVFVTLKSGVKPTPSLKEELRGHVGQHIGAIAKPDEVRFAEALPKTRSGKIMRRLLKEIASGKTVGGDTTTLEDFSVLAKLGSAEE